MHILTVSEALRIFALILLVWVASQIAANCVRERMIFLCKLLQITAKYCKLLQITAKYSKILQNTAKYCKTDCVREREMIFLCICFSHQRKVAQAAKVFPQLIDGNFPSSFRFSGAGESSQQDWGPIKEGGGAGGGMLRFLE